MKLKYEKQSKTDKQIHFVDASYFRRVFTEVVQTAGGSVSIYSKEDRLLLQLTLESQEKKNPPLNGLFDWA